MVEIVREWLEWVENIPLMFTMSTTCEWYHWRFRRPARGGVNAIKAGIIAACGCFYTIYYYTGYEKNMKLTSSIKIKMIFGGKCKSSFLQQAASVKFL